MSRAPSLAIVVAVIRCYDVEMVVVAFRRVVVVVDVSRWLWSHLDASKWRLWSCSQHGVCGGSDYLQINVSTAKKRLEKKTYLRLENVRVSSPAPYSCCCSWVLVPCSVVPSFGLPMFVDGGWVMVVVVVVVVYFIDYSLCNKT